MWRVYVNQHPWAGPWYRRIERQPGWVVKLALTAAVLVVAVPLLLLAAAAVFVGAIVFFVLSLAAAANAWLRGVVARFRGPWRDDGRRNVRVIPQDED